MNFKILCILALVFVVTPGTNCGWIKKTVGKFFGGVVNKATEGTIDHSKQAFRESMDYVFDNKINPLINQLEATADRVIDRAKDDINEVIENFKNQILDLVEKAANVAKDLVDHTVDEIKTKIIDNTFDQLNRFEDKLFQDMTSILNKIDAILKEVSCYAQAIVYRVTDEIKNVLPSWVDPFESCRVELDKLFPGEWMRLKLVSTFTPSQLYEYRKCRLISNLQADSPIEAVKMAFRDLEFLSGDMRCLSVSLGAIANEKYYIREMGNAYYILSTLGN
jgi:hypothetical protein